jgi:ubiquinone/menaquinone biosynthesis C-methylase UbiE
MAGIGFFTEDDSHRFQSTPLGAALESDAPGYARSSVRALTGPMAWGAWGQFLHAVRTGETGMDTEFGQPVFDYLGARPEEASRFNETMIGFHGEEPAAIAAACDFSGMRQVVDVGGGTGNLLTTVLAANPTLDGVLFDLPHVAAEARRAIDAKGLTGRCSVAEGSFFDAIPSGGDAYMMSHIIHDWNDEKSLTILGNCRRAMQGRGRLLLIENVIPAGNDFHPGKILDLVMLTFTGGLERTEAEYRDLYARAGFRLTRVVPTASTVSVIEGEPA